MKRQDNTEAQHLAYRSYKKNIIMTKTNLHLYKFITKFPIFQTKLLEFQE